MLFMLDKHQYATNIPIKKLIGPVGVNGPLLAILLSIHLHIVASTMWEWHNLLYPRV